MSELQTRFIVNDGTASLFCAKGVTIDAQGEKPAVEWISLKVEDDNLRFMNEAKVSFDEARKLTECLKYYLEL